MSAAPFQVWAVVDGEAEVLATYVERPAASAAANEHKGVLTQGGEVVLRHAAVKTAAYETILRALEAQEEAREDGEVEADPEEAGEDPEEDDEREGDRREVERGGPSRTTLAHALAEADGEAPAEEIPALEDVGVPLEMAGARSAPVFAPLDMKPARRGWPKAPPSAGRCIVPGCTNPPALDRIDTRPEYVGMCAQDRKRGQDRARKAANAVAAGRKPPKQHKHPRKATKSGPKPRAGVTSAGPSALMCTQCGERPTGNVRAETHPDRVTWCVVCRRRAHQVEVGRPDRGLPGKAPVTASAPPVNTPAGPSPVVPSAPTHVMDPSTGEVRPPAPASHVRPGDSPALVACLEALAKESDIIVQLRLLASALKPDLRAALHAALDDAALVSGVRALLAQLKVKP